MSKQDPFPNVRSEVESNLEQAKLLVESYERISRTSASDSTEVAQTREDLDQILEDIETDIADLQESVAVVAKNPEKYGLSTIDVERRHKFVAGVVSETARIKSTVHPTPAQNSSRYEEDSAEDNEQTEAERQQEEMYQQQLMEEQDVQLEGVFHTVGNLRQQANTMGQELGEQAEMLEEFEMAVDKSANKLQRGMKRVEIFLRKNEDSRSNCCIGLLIAVLIILLLLVVLI